MSYKRGGELCQRSHVFVTPPIMLLSRLCRKSKPGIFAPAIDVTIHRPEPQSHDTSATKHGLVSSSVGSVIRFNPFRPGKWKKPPRHAPGTIPFPLAAPVPTGNTCRLRCAFLVCPSCPLPGGHEVQNFSWNLQVLTKNLADRFTGSGLNKVASPRKLGRFYHRSISCSQLLFPTLLSRTSTWSVGPIQQRFSLRTPILPVTKHFRS